MVTMSGQPRTRAAGRRGPVAGGPGTKAVLIKGVTPELHKRFRLACVEEGLAAHQLLDLLLDQRDSRIRRRLAQMRSPLHRPVEDDE
ncbi:hypothetical protein J3996_gp64 [Mycobacterium phage Laurie]|uniref:Ribbon-helix-helix DNA binding domain protein n=2 Tax=Rosebushvirus TaxID=1982900 RepID=A0A1B2IHU1_9CAUD|nr:hypothetical protein J3996_gp64 [Mycobacterium phage Laurie]AER47295.1 hypothetical protein HEDGEROW_64 [Mycobacterium phage Hedgerow]ANZ52358.1 hypothetical protein SEA_LAURIE_64 [Mycobacterium phage Laurie]